MKFLITGLGNIGQEYASTRHNIGFMVLDYLADLEKTVFSTERLADKGIIKYRGRTLVLIRPNTYMNLSGKAVNYWLNQEKIEKQNLLVVTDDIALPFGKLRLRAKGSNAGHNGLANIDQLCGGNNYPRLKFGIGNDFPKGHQVDYVLSPFNQEEQEALPERIKKAADMILAFSTIGIDRTMNQFND